MLLHGPQLHLHQGRLLVLLQRLAHPAMEVLVEQVVAGSFVGSEASLGFRPHGVGELDAGYPPVDILLKQEYPAAGLPLVGYLGCLLRHLRAKKFVGFQVTNLAVCIDTERLTEWAHQHPVGAGGAGEIVELLDSAFNFFTPS